MTFNWHFKFANFLTKLNLRKENEYETHEYFLLLPQWERSQDCFHFHLRLCKEYLQRAQLYSAFQQFQRFNEKMNIWNVSARAIVQGVIQCFSKGVLSSTASSFSPWTTPWSATTTSSTTEELFFPRFKASSIVSGSGLQEYIRWLQIPNLRVIHTLQKCQVRV